MRYLVEYEVRALGAIGAWRLLSGTVDAETVTEALAAFRRRWEAVYEFRFPSRCEAIAK